MLTLQPVPQHRLNGDSVEIETTREHIGASLAIDLTKFESIHDERCQLQGIVYVGSHRCVGVTCRLYLSGGVRI